MSILTWEYTMRTNQMIEQMRLDFIADTFAKARIAGDKYYRQGYDNGEYVALIKELDKYGADPDEVFDTDWELREKYIDREWR